MQLPTRTVVLGILGAAAFNYLLAGLLGDVVFNIGRATIAVLGGWFIVTLAGRGIWVALGIGPMVMLLDHVILKGGYFVFAHFFVPGAAEQEVILAAGGVLVSYVMFVPVAAVLSFCGGVAAKLRNRNGPAHS